jgi:hypothetical protein
LIKKKLIGHSAILKRVRHGNQEKKKRDEIKKKKMDQLHRTLTTATRCLTRKPSPRWFQRHQERPLLDLEEAACTTTSPQQPPRTGVMRVLHSSPYLEKKGQTFILISNSVLKYSFISNQIHFILLKYQQLPSSRFLL